jgi:simple sugar transport system ATP-binding protein
VHDCEHHRDAGQLVVDGLDRHWKSPHDSIASGIETSNQDSGLAVAIGRAVMSAKHVIILDENTNHLGPRQSQEVLKVISAARDQGLCVLFISHTLPHVIEVSDRIVVLSLGKVVRDSPTPEYTVETLLATNTGPSEIAGT